jgi:hypothetical protein
VDGINEPISGRTRLLKMIVAFEVELFDLFKRANNNILEKENLPEFFAWNFGPMSTKVLEDLEFFLKLGFIEKEPVSSLASEEAEAEEISAIYDDLYLGEREDTEYKEEKYFLSNTGEEYVKTELIGLLSDSQIELLHKLKKQFNSATLHDILIYIYNNSKYEKYIKKEKSNIYNRYKY